MTGLLKLKYCTTRKGLSFVMMRVWRKLKEVGQLGSYDCYRADPMRNWLFVVSDDKPPNDV